MARIVRRKRRKLNLSGLATVLFTFSLIAQLATSLLVNTINTSLAMRIQAMNEEIAILKTENQNLTYEINTLENKDRIYEIAEQANLYQDSDNIIAVAGD
ncbi:MAG: hypothetical protein IKX97_03880 [Erysipelotrichaceae bacterium]|nr:hypothetical protein [Erysipelotrichaceae bacterium]MBR5754943.1 hypothetical protein [Erysipelotrichaceae bacterium]